MAIDLTQEPHAGLCQVQVQWVTSKNYSLGRVKTPASKVKLFTYTFANKSEEISKNCANKSY